MSKVKISVAKGDGIGPEIMDAVLRIFRCCQAPLSYEYVGHGEKCIRPRVHYRYD